MLELDSHVAAHVAVALREHIGALRKLGARVPPEVTALAEWARIVASRGQDGTMTTACAEVADGGRVPLLVDRDEAARLLGVSCRQVSRLVADDVLHPRRLGGAVRFAVAELEEVAGG